MPEKDYWERFDEEISRRESRMIHGRTRKKYPVWFGFGMFGMIGWSVMIPTLIGVAVGIWLDLKWSGRISWTLTLLIVGIILGCLNAWYWITKERKRIHEEEDVHD